MIWKRLNWAAIWVSIGVVMRSIPTSVPCARPSLYACGGA
jgi:hypothetical protein